MRTLELQAYKPDGQLKLLNFDLFSVFSHTDLDVVKRNTQSQIRRNTEIYKFVSHSHHSKKYRNLQIMRSGFGSSLQFILKNLFCSPGKKETNVVF